MNKKLIALALVFCMLLSLTACGSKNPKAEDLLGKWAVTLALNELGNTEELVGTAGLPMDADALNSLEISTVLEFAEDGTAWLLIPAESLDSMATSIIDAYMDYLRNGGLYTMMEAESGMTKEELDASLAESGMTMDDMIDMMATIIEGYDFASVIRMAAEQSGEDIMRGDDLVAEKLSYVLEDNVLTFTGEAGDAYGSMTVEYDSEAGTLLVTAAEGEQFTCFIGKTLTKQ